LPPVRASVHRAAAVAGILWRPPYACAATAVRTCDGRRTTGMPEKMLQKVRRQVLALQPETVIFAVVILNKRKTHDN